MKGSNLVKKLIAPLILASALVGGVNHYKVPKEDTGWVQIGEEEL